MNEMCSDDRFKIIEIAKKHLLEKTNIDTSKDEMKVLDNFLFRCWQMGWLEMYNSPTSQDEIDYYKHEYFSECDRSEALEKALYKACKELESLSYVKGIGQVEKNYEEWKEWCLKDEIR